MSRFTDWLKGNPPEDRNEQRALWTLGDDYSSGTSSGTAVNEQTAMKQSVVYAAITLIADGVASLRPRAYVDDEQGRRQYTDVPRWVEAPHPEVRRYEVFNQLLVSAISWGDGFALIDRRTDGQILGLRVLAPHRVTVEWDPNDLYARRYKIDGTGPWLTSKDVFHVQGPTLPGEASGMSVIRHARESIGLGLTLEEFGARYFGQGSQAKIVLEIPSNVDENKARDIVRTFERFHKGKNNWHRPAVMSGGAKLHNISINPDDAQFLESRKFQAVEIARWFRVPPHRVGIMDVNTSWGSGLSVENAAFLQNTLRPWITRLEDALSAYTVGGQARGVRIELQTDELLRGTFAEQATVFTDLVTNKILTRQEARDALGYPSDGQPDDASASIF